MVIFCAIIGCSNRGGRDKVSFFRLPAVIQNQGSKCKNLSERRRRIWLERINRLRRVDLSTSNQRFTRICSNHFISGKPSGLQYEQNPDWAPSLNLGYSDDTAPSDRAKKRSKTHTAALSLLYLASPKDDRDVVHAESQTQTETGGDTIDNLQQEVARLTNENVDLKLTLDSRRICISAFMEDYKVKLFTGLATRAVFLELFDFLSPFLPESELGALDKFQQVTLVLMRLRLNHSMPFLADYFNVLEATVSRTFLSVLQVMYEKMEPFITWPDRYSLRKTMPEEFRKCFGIKAAIIVDCFEIFIDCPSNLLAKKRTLWSTQHDMSAKFLIGITSRGVVSYLSIMYTGTTGDKHITENCGILDKLLPGDLLLADRGFDTSEDSAFTCVEVTMSTSCDKPQISPIEFEQRKGIEEVRMHVERVAENLRKEYSILQDTVPVVDFLCVNAEGRIPTLYKIVTVICALTNINESGVPID